MALGAHATFEMDMGVRAHATLVDVGEGIAEILSKMLQHSSTYIDIFGPRTKTEVQRGASQFAWKYGKRFELPA